MSTNFHLAPPSKTVDGLLCVPIDIQSITAVFTFDSAAKTATADATISYTVGTTAGNPIFDLRQTISKAWVDGAVFPVAKLAHHNFGAGTFTNLRVIEAVQAAGSIHTLRVKYNLGVPDAQLGGTYLPALEWLPGPKLRFAFGMSDLNKARYAEAWLPANLIFDQYSIGLELQITGAAPAHSVITNGSVTNLGANHWRVGFPSRFTALSPMLEIHSSDSVVSQTDTVGLPVSGKTVTITAWKPTAGAANLTTQINNIKTLLTNNENDYGGFVHDNRFTAFFNGGGGMEYEAGTTTSTGALLHETFHSWFARGIKPASQADGWWDEGFTSFHDEGANDAVPFDFSQPPIVLCSRDPWQRSTPGNSYSDGSAFWKGIASMVGVAALNNLMRDLYNTYKGNPVSTQMIEEFLVCRNGNPAIVDAFHRFVYGLGNPSPVPDLWLRDETGDPGANNWGGAFWDSPDLWIRNKDDGGTAHQAPEFGRDNWFYARVRNKSAAGTAAHFVVTFHSRGFAGTQFEYPNDFLPCIAAKADFDLAPGGTRIVKAKWPRALVPPGGTHTCLLASILTRSDHPVAGRHVWEHNNLAQKNLDVVDLEPNTFIVLPIVVRNWSARFDPLFDLEVLKPESARGISIGVLHKSKEFFNEFKGNVRSFAPADGEDESKPAVVHLDCGGELTAGESESDRPPPAESDNTRPALPPRFRDAFEALFEDEPASKIVVRIPPFTQNEIGLKINVTDQAITAKPVKLHFIQRNVKTKQIVGGVAVHLTVRKKQ